MKQAIVLAGGKGTRLAQSLGQDIPKPMAPVCGIPLLERTLTSLREQSFCDVVLLVHHRSNVIRDHFGDGSSLGLRILYVEESTPRGTGGALFDALPVLEERFAVLYGDTLVQFDLNKIWSFHTERDADFTLFAHPNDHPHDSDLLSCDSDGRVTRLMPYPHPEGSNFRNLVNAGLYMMNRNLLAALPSLGSSYDIAKHALPFWISSGAKLFAYRGDGYIKDMGTPERLRKVECDLSNGTVARKSGTVPRVAIFIDRDGTLNVPSGYLSKPNQMQLLPGVGAAIRSLNQLGILAIVITNQPVIARGEASFEDLEAVHGRMDHLLAVEGAFLDSVFVCPHHPDSGFPGERPELKTICRCRKPEPGLVEEALKRYSINLGESWFIGDTTTDIECANRLGMRSILVRSGFGGGDAKYTVEPTCIQPDLPAAISFIFDTFRLEPTASIVTASTPAHHTDVN